MKDYIHIYEICTLFSSFGQKIYVQKVLTLIGRENVGTTYSAQTIPTFSKAKANDTHVFKANPPFHHQLGYIGSRLSGHILV